MVKKAAVINDLSGFGKCSLTAAIPILSVMGVQPCPLPTAILTAQTGFENYFCDDYTDKMDMFIKNWQKMNVHFDAIYSGYIPNEKQIDIIIRFIKLFKTNDAPVIIDPVMADNGEMYGTCTEQMCKKIRSLVTLGDIITPNLTELCILCGESYKELIKKIKDSDYLSTINGMAQQIIEKGTKTVIVTGIRYNGFILNALCAKNKDMYISKSKCYENSYSGTGDIFTSIICAEVVNKKSIECAVETATKFLETVIADTEKQDIDPKHGINFEKYLKTL